MAVARMDGELGLNGRKAFPIFGGGLAGLIKSLGREWPGIFCRFLDIAAEISHKDAAKIILKELADSRRDLSEVGYNFVQQRFTLEVVNREPNQSQHDFRPHEKTVFVVSGGGHGITAKCVMQMQQRFTVNLFYWAVHQNQIPNRPGPVAVAMRKVSSKNYRPTAPKTTAYHAGGYRQYPEPYSGSTGDTPNIRAHQTKRWPGGLLQCRHH